MSICPKVTSQGVNIAVIAQLIDSYKDSLLGNKTPAYDGRKDLNTIGHVPIESKEFVIKLVDRDVHTKSMSYVPVGRSFFSTTYYRTDSLGDGLELMLERILSEHLANTYGIVFEYWYVVRGRLFNEGSSSGAGSGAKRPNPLLSQLGQSKEKWPMWPFWGPWAPLEFQLLGKEERFELFASAAFEEKGGETKGISNRFGSGLGLPLKVVTALKNFRW